MTFLVDANVLSEATKPAPELKVIEWLRANEDDSQQAGVKVFDPFA